MEKTWKAPPWPLSATPGTVATTSARLAGGAASSAGSISAIASVGGTATPGPVSADTSIAS